MTDAPELLIHLDTAPVHRAGYPMFVGITVENPLPRSTYYALPEIDRFDVPPPVQLVLTGPGGAAAQVLPAKTPGAHEGEPEGIRLGPGEMVRVLFDLSELHPALVAGRHTLGARYLAKPLRPEADPVSFDVEIPPEEEAAAAAKLCASNRAGAPSWNAFLTDNFREVDDEELADLGNEGRARLGYVRMLHQAVYGPDGPARLDPKAFDGLGTGALSGEVVVLEHEMLAARRDPGAALLEQRIVATWPGLRWRVRENYADDGLVTRMRRVYGADRAFPVPPRPLPYESPRP